MTLLTEIKNVDGHFTSTVLVLFLSLIAPGVLTIYLFLPELFEKLDGLKFILFSTSLSLPVFILNGFCSRMCEPQDEDVDFQMTGISSGLMSSIIMYSMLVVAYFFDFTFSQFLTGVILVEAIYFCIALILYRKSIRKLVEEELPNL
ncbi:hypothetical protein CGG89_08215 [Vibrio parahaemolyticus]|nr:hypothetical protein CGG89_08215 [Vibrio parahaemolyticus]HCE1552059.1 hypothetical protein [Vibrio parahaemolyticus]HCE3201594.1 hypothetical protein [Vibrio parahaemolyticus]HCG5595553.1 hypothetical protein [Vibrio parahaemolyticus]HCG9430342.1 hypothetical protein [Vibrio parahaemolyticus]